MTGAPILLVKTYVAENEACNWAFDLEFGRSPYFELKRLGAVEEEGS